MPRLEKHYEDGQIIFREGEASTAAFVCLQGEIRLFKDGARGRVELARMGKGEMFGEMGVLDGGQRSASAEAWGAVRVEVIPRSEFLRRIEADPALASRVMNKLVERLRTADEMLVKPPVTKEKSTKASKSRAPVRNLGIFGRLFGAGKRAAAATIQPPYRPSILIAAAPSEEPEAVRRLTQMLGWLEYAALRPIERPPLLAGIPEARQWMASEGGEALLWQAGSQDGLTALHVITPYPSDERIGGPVAEFPLHIPTEYYPPWNHLVGALIMSGLDPRGEDGVRRIHAHLIAGLEAVDPLVMRPPAEIFDLRGQGLLLAAHGAIAAQAGLLDPQSGWLADATESWRRASRLFETDSPGERSFAQLRQAYTLYALGERSGDASHFADAANLFRLILSSSPDLAPREKAKLTNRLGLALLGLDRRSPDEVALKEAVTAFQQTLAATPKAEDPRRWAEIMHNLAQALELYGAHIGSPEALTKAAEACRAALEVWTWESTPLSWASAQNTLGTSLFLLAKRNGSTLIADQAAEAFRAALMVYEAQGSARLAAQAKRNLERCEQAVVSRPSYVSDPDWN